MRIRLWVTRVVLAAGALCLPWGLFKILNADAPLLDSPLSRYVAALGIAAFFLAATLSPGLWLTRRILPGRLRWEERLSVGFIIGIMLFQAATFALGLLGLLNPAGAVIMAGGLTALGSANALRIIKLVRHQPHPPRAPSVRQHVVLSCIGALTLGFLAAHTLTADSVGYDSSWYHLPVAEAYAATGAIRPFRDGWLLGTYPQMASLIYAWALVLAGRSSLGLTSAAFIELTFVASTIFSIVPLTRMLLPKAGRLRWAWLCVTLFPAVFLYPPRVEADYLAAAFAAVLLICGFKVWERADTRSVVLGALLLAGVLLVKYSALGTCVLPLLLATAGLLRQLWQKRRAGLGHELVQTARKLGLAALTFLAVTSTHWLKNWAFYKDPLFPSHTPVTDFSPTAHAFYEAILKTLWIPVEGVEGWKESFWALFTFSFEPHEYPEHNSGHPIFGSLFTLTLAPLLLLFFLKRGRRALVAHLGTLLAVLVWYRIHHQDRYLLALLPWMCAVTAATLYELWQSYASRALVIVTCCIQLCWGARWAVKLFPLDQLERTLWCTTAAMWDDHQVSRWNVLYRVGRAVPSRGVVMVHDERIRLGLRRTSVSDSLGFETRLSMGDLGTDANIFDRLSALGVTHLYGSSRSGGFTTLADELFFYGFFRRYGRPTALSELRGMPKTRPPLARAEDRLAFIDVCGAVSIEPGLYHAAELKEVTFGMPLYLQSRPVATAKSSDDAAPLLERAEFLILNSSCSFSRRVATQDNFDLMTTRGSYWFFQKR